jgi:hypothetical protein
MFGSGISVSVPACGGCAWRLRAQRWGRLLAIVLLSAVVLFFVWPWINDVVAKPLRKWAAMLLIVLCLSPVFVWHALFAPAVDIAAFTEPQSTLRPIW